MCDDKKYEFNINGNNMKSKYNIIIGDKTVEEWDKKWQYIGKLKLKNIEQLKGQIGLYRIKYNVCGEEIYIGKATESENGTKGLYKRLHDYITEDTEKKRDVDKYIYKNRNNLDVYVIKFGTSIEARAIANGLESLFIDYHYPYYNKQK